MTSSRTWTPVSEMAMAEDFVQPWDTAGRRSARRRTGGPNFPINLGSCPSWFCWS